MTSSASFVRAPGILDLEMAVAHWSNARTGGLQATDRAAREEILHRAYSIWESRGCPDHLHLEHWLEAEAEILPPVPAIAATVH